MKELGYDLVSGSSRGYSAPKGIPDDVKETLINAFKKIAEMPEFVEACAARDTIIDMKYGEDYKKMLETQEAEFKQIWDEVKDDYTKK